MKDKIVKLLREASEDKKGEKGSSSAQYKRIHKLLQNNIFNHAEIIEKLWGEKDATNRSLFRKKLNREQTSGGKTHEFTDEEISKIALILMDTSADIDKNLGAKPKGEKDKD